MKKNTSVKNSFSIAGIAFALYGILRLALALYYSIAMTIVNKLSFTYFITSFDSTAFLIGSAFIGLGVMLVLSKNTYLPAIVTSCTMLVYYLLTNLADVVSCFGGIVEIFKNIKHFSFEAFKATIADILVLPYTLVFALAFAAFTFYIVLACVSNNKNKRSKILAMWFIPGAVCFVGGVVYLITILIAQAINTVDFLFILNTIFRALAYIAPSAAMILYCMNLNKENKRYEVPELTEEKTEEAVEA